MFGVMPNEGEVEKFGDIFKDMIQEAAKENMDTLSVIIGMAIGLKSVMMSINDPLAQATVMGMINEIINIDQEEVRKYNKEKEDKPGNKLADQFKGYFGGK